jgi:hypothetical protein
LVPTSAALADYVFKARVVETFGRGDQLLQFFAIYYAATSFVTFLVQATSSRKVLERFGLAVTTSTPSLALLAGGVGNLIAPGFASLVAARAVESAFRGSLFRAGYELLYTPIPARQKRPAKSIIDVAFDRLGDALGGGLVRAIAGKCTGDSIAGDSRDRARIFGRGGFRLEPLESRLHQHARAQPDSPRCRHRHRGGGEHTHPVADRRHGTTQQPVRVGR